MKREGGGCTQILVALIAAGGVIIAAVLGGPLVEKWLDQNDTNDNAGGGSSIQGGPIGVVGIADPLLISVGQMTEIRVQTLRSDNSPLPGATVTINSGGGIFQATGTTTVSGITGNDGFFRTPWRCDPCAPSYIMDVRANKENFTEGLGVVFVTIQ